MSRVTISKGKQAVQERVIPESARIRQGGGGRKPLRSHDAHLLEALNTLIDPCTRGDPESPLRGTYKSTYKMAGALQAQGHRLSQRSVYALLKEGGYKSAVESETRRRHTASGSRCPVPAYQSPGEAVSTPRPTGDFGKRDKFHGEWNYKIMPQK